MGDLKLCSCNARGLRQTIKRRTQFAYFHRHKFDVILVQETHSTFEDERYWRNEWGGDILFSHGTTSSKGVAILFKRQLYHEIVKTHCDQNGRYIIVDVNLENRSFTIVCTYGPNHDDPDFFSGVSRSLYNFSNTNSAIIWGGDFNFVFNLASDKFGGAQKTNFKARDECLSAMYMHNLVDIWRERNPLSKEFFWHSGIANIHCRLDYFLISRDIVANVLDAFFQPPLQSDHSLVILSLRCYTECRGKGYWKFNNSLLADKNYTDLIEIVIRRELSNSSSLNPSSN